MTVVAVVLFSILDVVAAFTNLTVLCIILPRNYLRTVSNLFLVGLTSTQLLMTLLVIPFSIVTFSKQEWSFSDGFCKLEGYLTTFLSISSATFISVISVDRFFSLANPMSHAGNITGKHVIFASLFNWFHSAFWAAFPLFGLEGLNYKYFPAKNGCAFRWDLKGSYRIFYYFIAMESFILPSFTICLMYFKSFQTARKSARQIRPGNIQIQVLQNGEFTTVAQTNSYQSCKANCTLTVIIGSFLISRGPLTIFNIVNSFTGEGYFSSLTETTVSFLLLLGPLLDSLVYFFLNRKLRQELYLILRKCFKSKSDGDEEPKDIVDYLRSIADNVEKRHSSTDIETHDIE